ncbi:predicted protein [Botrytis cinerea T4]|uniref:Uncharacterized protein n=1 Tax=Botryotinia fuckeliana (strain T4) TaxID=999810 RepID=G2Y5M7_BOTF4|nr:predicted protein [Botrytis cinerea T4]
MVQMGVTRNSDDNRRLGRPDKLLRDRHKVQLMPMNSTVESLPDLLDQMPSGLESSQDLK